MSCLCELSNPYLDSGGVRSRNVLALVKKGVSIGSPNSLGKRMGGEWGTGGSPEWILNSLCVRSGFALRVLGLDPSAECEGGP